MKNLVSLLVLVLFVSPSFAGLDPDYDSLGIYFDMDGNVNCTTVAAFLPFPAYLILMNPAGPTSGFECSVSITGAQHIVLSTVMDGCDIDVELPPGDFACSVGADYTVRPSGAVVLVSWMLVLGTPCELLFRIGPASIPSLPGGLPVVTGNGVLRQCSVASGDVSVPVARVNTSCVTAEESSSFGGIKALYR